MSTSRSSTVRATGGGEGGTALERGYGPGKGTALWPCEQIDRHLWNQYLSTSIVEGGKYVFETWWPKDLPSKSSVKI